jgi:anionic cell wall polymer biosynthesis LytR-Cps2A-Psr (LCP) family protein
MVEALRIVVGAHVIDKVAKTPDGSDFVSIDNYLLSDVIRCATEHATRPEIEDVLALMSGFFDTNFDFRETINQNMLKLKEVATRIKQFGITSKNQMIVLIANINRAAKNWKVGHGIPKHHVQVQEGVPVQPRPRRNINE